MVINYACNVSLSHLASELTFFFVLLVSPLLRVWFDNTQTRDMNTQLDIYIVFFFCIVKPKGFAFALKPVIIWCVCFQYHTFWLSCISYLETYTISLIYRCPAYRAFPFPHGRCILTHLNSISKIWTKKIKTNEHLMNITQNKALF